MNVLSLIEQRAEFLRSHPRVVPGEFARDFIDKFGYGLLCQLDRFDDCGAIRCTPQTLLRSAVDAAARKRLQRGLQKLVDQGTLERLDASEYRLAERTAEAAAVRYMKSR